MKKLIFLIVVFLSGCSKTSIVELHLKKENSNSPKKIALFLDGTANSLKSRTNVSRLFNIVSNQDKDNLYLFYNEGVGTRGVGQGTGIGLGKDVREAYLFLAENYSKDSELYMFGFSRGAYTARILAGMIYTVGIYNLNSFSKSQRKEIVNDLYFAYKGIHKNKFSIRAKSKNIIKKKWNYLNKYHHTPLMDDIKIKIIGLWDTVEAMGLSSTEEALMVKLGKEDKQNIINPNPRYFDQICNINHVLHALSLDDNRANLFTPIIMTSEYMKNRCKQGGINVSKKVNEVWFSGAHADIGGGYDENNSLSGISLNWMMSQINRLELNDKFKLLPKNVKVYENENGYMHNAEKGIKLIYAKSTRGKILKKYIDSESLYGKVRIHKSVINRLKNNLNKNGYDSKWYKVFNKCFSFDNEDNIIEFRESTEECTKILEVVNNENKKTN